LEGSALSSSALANNQRNREDAIDHPIRGRSDCSHYILLPDEVPEDMAVD